MGSAVGDALARGGARVVATVAGRSERTAGLAARAGIELLRDLGAVVRAADIVLSIVPPGEAERVAAEVAAAGETLLADLNAVSPETARRISTAVDGSISGPPPWRPGTTTIYLSGPRAGDIAALPFDGVAVVIVGDEAGAASAVKMSTASVYKGGAALLAQALATARANGVLEHVLADLGVLAEGAGPRIGKAAAKSGRFVAEMHEIARTQEAAGLSGELFDAFALVYGRLARSAAGSRAPEEIAADVPLEQVLAECELPEGLEVRDADTDQA